MCKFGTRLTLLTIRYMWHHISRSATYYIWHKHMKQLQSFLYNICMKASAAVQRFYFLQENLTEMKELLWWLITELNTTKAVFWFRIFVNTQNIFLNISVNGNLSYQLWNAIDNFTIHNWWFLNSTILISRTTRAQAVYVLWHGLVTMVCRCAQGWVLDPDISSMLSFTH